MSEKQEFLSNDAELARIPYIDDPESDLSQKDSDLSRNLTKSVVDSPFDDEVLFLDWDKERNLFQDYINSLRKEIRVLLQERFEYQQQDESTDEQMKMDLLQKSLEEKNSVIEQFQTEYESIKEKNIDLLQKLSLAECDTKSHVNITEELKQKLADLTIDLQNHLLVKRRLEMSIQNLENDCKIIDAERIRLTSEIKDHQHQKQDFEKSMQKANVQIAEQGSTIEMLRSENVQLRSQLSTIQRRMFQEKQQIMDYLRQIENDLIEKEQIKQREAQLRQDYEQLKGSTHDLQKLCDTLNQRVNELNQTGDKKSQQLDLLKAQCVQLESANQAWQEFQQAQLENIRQKFRNYLPLENNLSFDEITQSIVEHLVDQSTPLLSHDQDAELRRNIEVLTTQCAQLDKANRAWETYQLAQIDQFRNTLRDYLPLEDDVSFDGAARLIVEQMRNEREESAAANLETIKELSSVKERYQQLEREHRELRTESENNLETIRQSYLNTVDELNRELLALKEQMFINHQQSSPSDEINQIFDQLRNILPISPDASFDDIISHINTLVQENNQQLLLSDKPGLPHSIALDQKLHEENLLLQNQCTELDNANRAWQQFYDNQLNFLRTQFKDYLDLDRDSNFDQIIRTIVAELDSTKNGLHSSPHSSVSDSQQIENLQEEIESLENQLQDYRSSIDLIKQENEQLKQQNHHLKKQTDTTEEIDQLQAHISLLTTRCNQLDQANHAWQEFHQNQLEPFREKLQDFIPIDYDASLDQIAQEILDQSNSLRKQLESYQSKERVDKSRTHQQDDEYIDEISSLSPKEVSDHLQRECEQIFSKQNLSYPDFDLNQLALVAIHSLFNQHLIDEAKQLYDETVIRALKEEYELISKEKNDLIEQSLQSRENLSLANSDSNHLPREENLTAVNGDGFERIKTKIDRIVNERPELFPELSIDPIERLDQLIAAIEHRTAQIDLLKKEVTNSAPLLSDKQIEQLIDERNQVREEKSAIDKENQYLKSELSDRDEQIIKLNEELTTSSARFRQTTDQEIQTDDQPHERSVQMNNKLKRALQTIKEKVHRIVTDKPELFPQISDDTIERIDQLISTVEHQADQIVQLQQNLSEKDAEQTLLQQRLDDVELQFRKTIESFEQQNIQSAESRLEIEQLKEEIIQLKEIETSLNQSIQTWTDTIEQQSNELTDLSEKYSSLLKSHHELKKEDETRLKEYQNEIDNLMEELQRKTSPSIQTVDHESQTEDHQHEKLVQMNNKLKRLLQSFKEKIQRVVTERPDLFDGVGEETGERLEHLISTVENQAKQIEEQLQKTSRNELDDKDQTSKIEDYQKQIEELQHNLSEEGEERALLQQRLDEVQHELRKTSDDYASMTAKYESLVQATESQREIELQRSSDYHHADEDIDTLHRTIDEQSQQIEDLNEKTASLSFQLESQAELIKEKKQIENRLHEYEDQIDHLVHERTNLFKELEAKTQPVIQTADHESQTDDRQHEKMLQLNTKLKRALQSVKDKIHRVAAERPDLFDNVSEDTIERLDRLIATVENQATQANILQTERNQADEEHQRQIRELQSSLEASQYELENERRVKIERPVFAAPPPTNDISSAEMENYEKQIKQLQQHLSQKDDERTLLRERLNEIELEFRKTLDDQASTMSQYEALIKEKDALVEQQNLQSIESQRDIEQLQEKLAELQQLPVTHHAQIQTEEDINSLYDLIEQQSQQLKDLNEKNTTLESQLESQAELDRQKRETDELVENYRNQIEDLTRERANLLQEMEEKIPPFKQTVDHESQTNDHQHEKVLQMNNKLKRLLQSFKEKIQRVVVERPDLFDGVGEETSERLEHLISTVENQATQIDSSHAERNQVEEQLRNEIQHLQSSLEASQNELDYERQMKIEELSSSPPNDNRIAAFEEYQNQIEQLQQDLSAKDNQNNVLSQRLSELERELQRTIRENQLKSNQYRESVQSMIEQQVINSQEQEQTIEQLMKENDQIRKELADLKWSIDLQRTEISTNPKVYIIDEFIERPTEDLQTLDEDYFDVPSNDDQEPELSFENQRVPSEQTPGDENGIDDHQHEKLLETNNQLIDIVQTFEDRIKRIVTERPDLFHNVGDQTNEQLEHLISTIENQATQIDALHAQRDQIEEQLQNQIKQIQSSLETKVEQLSSLQEDNSVKLENYEKHIEELQHDLSQKEAEHTSLQERLSEVEQELRKTVDDHISTTAKYESLVEERLSQATESQREIELQQSPDYDHAEAQTDEDIEELHQIIDEQCQQIEDLNEKTTSLSSQLESQAEVLRQKEKIEERLNERENEIETLVQEHKNLLEEIERKNASAMQTTDNESQTDELEDGHLLQANKKFKRVLHKVKNQIQRFVDERPELFDDIDEDLNERLHHLILIVENQVAQINTLEAERYQMEEQLQSSLEISHNEGQIKTEQLSSAVEENNSSIVKEYQKHIDQLQAILSEKDIEMNSSNQRLNALELELEKTIHDHASKSNKYERNLHSLTEARNALVEQQGIYSEECEQKLQQLKKVNQEMSDELAELKRPTDTQQVEIQTDEDINALHELVEQQTEQLKTLNEKCLDLSSQVDSNAQLQVEIDRQRNDNEQQINSYRNQIEDLIQERAKLLEEMEKQKAASTQTTDSENQTDDDRHEEMIQASNQLRDQIQRMVTERPNLFDGVGEETGERFEHLLSTIETQAAEHHQVEEELQKKIKELQTYNQSLEASQNEFQNEHRTQLQQLSSQFEETRNSMLEDYEKQIQDLQQQLSDKDNERSVLNERLDEVQLELTKTSDNHASTVTKYESLIKERDELTEQHQLHSAQSQRDIEQLKDQIIQLQQSPDYHHAEAQTDEDIEVLHLTIDQQSQQLKDLNEKTASLSSELITQKEEIENLMQNIEKENVPPIEKTDTESQTDESQDDNLSQGSKKLKRALHKVKNQIQRIVDERPELFDGVGEDSNERLDHLISIVQNQKVQINALEAERNQTEEQLQSTSVAEEHQKRVEQLQENLSEKDIEINSLDQRLNALEFELQRTIDERDALVEQQIIQSEEQKQKIEQLTKENDQIREELADLKSEIQTNSKTNILDEFIERSTEEVQTLNENYSEPSSQVDSTAQLQLELDRQRNENEQQISHYRSQVENLTQERTKLLEEMENQRTPSAQTIDGENQTDDDHHEEILQSNTQLKDELQTIKDKLQQVGTDRPKLFDGVGEGTGERFDYLISTIENQTTQIDVLHAERDQIKQIQSSLETKVEQLSSLQEDNSAKIGDYQQHIEELQHNLSQKEAEHTSLKERLREVEQELRKTVDDHISTTAKYESLVEERSSQATESQREIEQLKEQLTELQQSPDYDHAEAQTDEDIEELHQIIDEQCQQIEDLNEKTTSLSSQLESQAEVLRQKEKIEERLKKYENEVENLTQERQKLQEEIEKKNASAMQKTDNESQTDDQQDGKSGEVNKKLKRALHKIKNQIERLVTERPELFEGIGEDSNERLDHLISIVEYQAANIDALQAERDHVTEQLREANKELESTVEAYEYQMQNERPRKAEQLQTASPDLQQEINQLREALSRKDDERILSQKHLDEIELELQKRLDDQTSTMSKYQSLVNERDALVEQHKIYSTESQREIEQLKYELAALQRSPDSRHREIQTEDDEHEKILDMNRSLTSTLDIIKDKCQGIIMERPDLFEDTNEENSEHLDRLIASIKTQASHIAELQKSFDLYRQQTDEYIASLTPITSDTQTQTIDLPSNESPNIHHSIESADPESNAWFDASPDVIEKQDIELENLKVQIQQIALEHLAHSSENPSENLNHITSLLKNLQTEITDLHSSLDTLRNERLIRLETLQPHDAQTQTLGLSLYEEHEKRLEKFQHEIERLIEERDQARDLLTDWKESPKIDVAIQTMNNPELSSTSDQAISRRIFEHEMLAWSKESEQLKRFVKQIQIENKKLKDIIQKFETTMHDYLHENERLKQENRHLSSTNYSSLQNENFTNSDHDVCYLTLKWLTYEVSQRSEQVVSVTDDTERQMKILRLQNERLKNQLETYTIQFKRIQHEMTVKIQEMSGLKDALERLRTNEIQSRVEIDRLKSELQTDQIKIQQLERELSDLKFKQSNKDIHSTDVNLRELLQLKERELNALKEKLDYTNQKHQIELQEVQKANQFSLANAKRLQQLDLCHEEKRKELETRLTKFCKMTRPLVGYPQLFIENPIINIEELRKLIADTDNEQRVTSSLSPIRDCLSLLEAQMKDLHHNIIENHARRSKRWKYKLGFECLSCESRWEVTHDIRDLQEACSDPSRFLESSMVEPMAGCSCPIMIDFIESDIRLCLDDIINDICVRTTVK